MGLVMVSGNYGFFNTLTVALCCCLLDDQMVRSALATVGLTVDTVPPWLTLAEPTFGLATALFGLVAGLAMIGGAVLFYWPWWVSPVTDRPAAAVGGRSEGGTAASSIAATRAAKRTPAASSCAADVASAAATSAAAGATACPPLWLHVPAFLRGLGAGWLFVWLQAVLVHSSTLLLDVRPTEAASAAPPGHGRLLPLPPVLADGHVGMAGGYVGIIGWWVVGCFGMLLVAELTLLALLPALCFGVAVAEPLFTGGVHQIYVQPVPVEYYPFAPLHHILRPFGIGGCYGLFARMTTVRGELVLSGTIDGGRSWREYAWRYKPGCLDRSPVLVCPGHMPRLDWRLWFVPLKLMRGGALPAWFDRFVKLLMDGSPHVLDLLGSDPFHGERPSQVRVDLYDYRFRDSPNATEQFMPQLTAGEWERGRYWQRRHVAQQKVYSRAAVEQLREATHPTEPMVHSPR
jgi:hypothetical protein